MATSKSTQGKTNWQMCPTRRGKVVPTLELYVRNECTDVSEEGIGTIIFHKNGDEKLTQISRESCKIMNMQRDERNADEVRCGSSQHDNPDPNSFPFSFE